MGSQVWPQTYQALRAPLPPLEDAPLPPPPRPGRAGWGREERCEGAEIDSALLLLLANPGWGHRAAPALLARSAAGSLLARPLPGRLLSRVPAAARFFNVHRQ